MRRLSALWAPLWLAAACTSFALETDQYWAWGQPLADSTEVVNARFNLELERAIAGFPESAPPAECRQVAAAFYKRTRSLLLHDIQLWAWNSDLVERVPDGGDEQREFRRTNLYSNHALIDPATWMPSAPTIELDGVRVGTDKLSHFVSSGWIYYGEYRKALARGDRHVDAARSALRRGLLEESAHLGGKTSGVQAIADLEASYAGMRFYRDLCDADDPILRREDDEVAGWSIARPIDLRDYVTPRWDESYQPSVYGKRRWERVRPVLEGYCDRLVDPQVVLQRRRYRERDRPSLVGEVVAERVAAGKLADPARFGIEAVCGESHTLGAMLVTKRGSASYRDGANSGPAIGNALVEEENDRRRFALGLVGAKITYPQVVSASIAIMPTSQPSSYDCRTPCEFRGPVAQFEPGLGGAKLSLGWAKVTGRTNRSGSFLKEAYIGTAYKLTVLRTWGNSGWVEGDRTYGGVDFGLPIARANLGLGLLYRLDGDDGSRWLVTGGIGWGF